MTILSCREVRRLTNLVSMPAGLSSPPTGRPGSIQEAEPRPPNLPPVQLWERPDGTGQEEYRGPTPQWVRYRRLSGSILYRCSRLDVHRLLHSRPGFLHSAPLTQQVCDAQTQVRLEKHSKDNTVTINSCLCSHRCNTLVYIHTGI